MTHARTTIRQAFVELLLNKTIAADKVYDSRLYSLKDKSLPAIIVFSNNEDATVTTISRPRSQDRTVKIIVECYVKATFEVNVIVDQLSAQVEQLVIESKTLQELCKDHRLESTDININVDGDQPVAVASLTFAVIYRIKEDNPEKIILYNDNKL